MNFRQVGACGPQVSAIGLGCMSIGLGDVYTSATDDDAQAIALIHKALDLGINFLDTANIYGDSEIKIGRALRGRRDGVVLATKFGFINGATAQERAVDGSAENVRRACDQSLHRLEIDQIDLFYLHRVDSNTEIEETVGAMAELVRLGKVRHIGLSEACPETVRRAHKVHPIAAVQTEYSLFSREPEEHLLPTLRELGIALVAYSPLGRGFLGGRFRSIDDLAANDWRRGNPRFQGDRFEMNLQLAENLRALAEERGCTPAELALAWILTRHRDVIPIPGTSSTARLEENARSVDLTLSPSEIERIEQALPKASARGERYAPEMMKIVNG